MFLDHCTAPKLLTVHSIPVECQGVPTLLACHFLNTRALVQVPRSLSPVAVPPLLTVWLIQTVDYVLEFVISM